MLYTEQEQNLVDILSNDCASLPIITLTDPTHQLMSLARCYAEETELPSSPSFLCWRVESDPILTCKEKDILLSSIAASIAPRGSLIGWLMSLHSYDYSDLSWENYVRLRNVWIKQTLANHNTTVEEQLKDPSIVIKFVRWYRNRIYW